jgi:hypothetical protein
VPIDTPQWIDGERAKNPFQIRAGTGRVRISGAGNEPFAERIEVQVVDHFGQGLRRRDVSIVAAVRA